MLTQLSRSELQSLTLHQEAVRSFRPLFEPARYKGAYGGRGSGKSHFFAELLIRDCIAERGLLSVCIREVQKDLAHSSKRLIEAKLAALGIGEAQQFKVSAMSSRRREMA